VNIEREVLDRLDSLDGRSEPVKPEVDGLDRPEGVALSAQSP